MPTIALVLLIALGVLVALGFTAVFVADRRRNREVAADPARTAPQDPDLQHHEPSTEGGPGGRPGAPGTGSSG